MRRHKSTTHKVICLWLTLFLTVSCQEHTIYHSYQPVETAGWHKNDTLIYSLPQALANVAYQYEIGIRHKDTYPYRDIWLKVNQDTIHLYLADSIGKWRGHGIGGTRQLTFPVQLKTNDEDSIREFRITHIMQDQPLSGVHNIGIKISKLP